MGMGINLARPDAPLHAQVIDDFKDQLLIVLIKRLADEKGALSIPVEEIDDTGRDLLSFSVVNRVFNFVLSKKS